MNYYEVIQALEEEVRTDSIWTSEASKLTDLRNLLYVGAIAIAQELPLSEFNLSTSTLSVTANNSDEVNLPDDLFSYRGDGGIDSLIINGERVKPYQANSYGTVSNAARNSTFFNEDEYLFNIDIGAKRVYGFNLGLSIDVDYLPLFTQPDDTWAALQSAEYPLRNKNMYEAVSMAAAHLQGSRKRDSQGAQFNMILTNLYGGRNNG